MWKEEGEKNNLKTESKRDKKEQTRRKSKTEIIYAIERRRERERGKTINRRKELAKPAALFNPHPLAHQTEQLARKFF